MRFRIWIPRNGRETKSTELGLITCRTKFVTDAG